MQKLKVSPLMVSRNERVETSRIEDYCDALYFINGELKHLNDGSSKRISVTRTKHMELKTHVKGPDCPVFKDAATIK